MPGYLESFWFPAQESSCLFSLAPAHVKPKKLNNMKSVKYISILTLIFGAFAFSCDEEEIYRSGGGDDEDEDPVEIPPPPPGANTVEIDSLGI